MGHLFVLCGPPGAGKTKLLKTIEQRKIKINQLHRLTTRKQRKEEGDKKGEKSLEYEFLNEDQFAERLSKGNIASLIEWDSNYYATQISEIRKAFELSGDSILLEDIPSALILKEKYKSNVTVIFLFTADKDQLLNNLDFASYEDSTNEFLVEWRYRLGLKYDGSMGINTNVLPEHDYKKYLEDKKNYITNKMNRAITDLAFIVGKIRDNSDLNTIANRRDRIDEAVNEFLAVVETARRKKVEKINVKYDEELDPSKLKLGFILKNMTTPQLWKTIAAIITLLTAVAFTAYKIGAGKWP